MIHSETIRPKENQIYELIHNNSEGIHVIIFEDLSAVVYPTLLDMVCGEFIQDDMVEHFNIAHINILHKFIDESGDYEYNVIKDALTLPAPKTDMEKRLMHRLNMIKEDAAAAIRYIPEQNEARSHILNIRVAADLLTDEADSWKSYLLNKKQ